MNSVEQPCSRSGFVFQDWNAGWNHGELRISFVLLTRILAGGVDQQIPGEEILYFSSL
jgi:hypothetical protein